jgi:predicted RNase H-like nuclease (RuvC/YqgF family)
MTRPHIITQTLAYAMSTGKIVHANTRELTKYIESLEMEILTLKDNQDSLRRQLEANHPDRKHSELINVIDRVATELNNLCAIIHQK